MNEQSNSQNGLGWSFFGVWNDSLLQRKERPIEPRSHMWASELGGSYVDRFLKMKGVAPTNPPNERSLRKFQAGNIWEWIIGYVLKRAGILIDSQEYIKFQYPGLLEVTGKLDLLAGGTPDWERARAEVKSLGLPEFLEETSLMIISQLKNQYGDKLKTVVLEIKSCSTFMFDKYESTGKPNPNHRLQAFHYLKGKELPEAHVVYVCKDDCRMLELGIFNPSSVEEEYKKDIETMTNIWRSGEQPTPESEVSYNPETGRIEKNWKVEYSPYLEMLYGYQSPEHYRERWDKDVASMNRVLTRCISGANMTKLNLEIIEKAESTIFPNWTEIVDHAKSVRQLNNSEDSEEE